MRQTRRKAGRRLAGGMWWKAAAVLAVVFVLANGVMWAMYRGRALPHSSLGQLNVSGKTFASLEDTNAAALLPPSITFQKGGVAQQSTPAALGIEVDASASVASLKHSVWRWLPVLSLAVHHHAPLALSVDASRSASATAALVPTFSQPALPKHIVWSGSDFAIAPSRAGFRLDTNAFMPAVTAALQRGQTLVEVPTQTLAPPAGSTNLNDVLQALEKELSTNVAFVYNGQTVTPTKSDIGGWFASDGQSMAPSASNVSTYLSGVGKRLGISIANQADLATAAAYATQQTLSRTLQIAPDAAGTAVRTYCTNVRGVSSDVLNELEQKLALTYTDVRGWSDNGHIAFKHVSSGCQYTVWMAASSQMGSFGAICDDYYNCQIGTNVVLNYDRWTSATPPWNKTGGSLDDYHTLMIDHETGHRLGFPDNFVCPGAGQPAPVMMQQSIDLKGCVFNIWPRPAELAQLNQMLGLGATTSVQAHE